MKLFRATRETQGEDKRDFSYANDGEILKLPASVCDARPLECGCGRCLDGIDTHKGTTTFRLEEDPELTEADLDRMLRASYEAAGWPTEVVSARTQATLDLIERADLMYEEGTILETAFGHLMMREARKAAGSPV